MSRISNDSITLAMNYNRSVRAEKVASKFFDLFESLYPKLDFELMGQWEPLKTSFDRARAILEWGKNRSESKNQFGDYVFHGTEPAPFYAFVHWFGDGPNQQWADSISITFDERFWTERLLKDPSLRLLEMMKNLSTIDGPLYGRAFHRSESEAKNYRDRRLPNGLVGRESVSLTPREGIVDLFWANYFGRPYVRIVGEESLRDVECPIKEYAGEGYLIAFSSTPFEWRLPAVHALEERAKAKLDHGIFLDFSSDFRPNLRIKPERSSGNVSSSPDQ
jgi:hypothetical protein